MKNSETIKENMNNISASFLKTTARLNKCSQKSLKNLLTKKHYVDDPNNDQLDNIKEEAIEDCKQYFHRCNYKSEYEVKIIRGESGEKLNLLTAKKNWYKKLHDPIDQQNLLDVKLNENEQSENSFSSDVVQKWQSKISDTMI